MSDIEKRVDDALETIMKASGSSLKNYMPSTKESMRKAMLKIMKAEYISGSNACKQAYDDIYEIEAGLK